MASKRNKIEIIYDILFAIKEKNNRIKITQLLHKANISHAKSKPYLEELFEKELIKEITEKKQKFFSLTDKGFEYLNKLDQMKKFMKTFEI